MRQRFAFEEHALAIGAGHRRAVGVVEHAFDEIARRCEVFEALLILDADGVAAELIGEAHGGDVHFALQQDLRLRQLRGLVGAELHLQALALQPSVNRRRVVIADVLHRGIEGGLAEPLLEAAGGVQQVIRDDRVEHAHAAFIEDAEDGFAGAEATREVAAGLLVIGGQFQQRQIANVGLIMRDFSARQPLAQTGLEKGVGEGLAPQCGVAHAGLCERGVKVQHADESRPLAAPVRHREDRAAVRGQSGQHMMRILPDSLGNDQRRVGIDAAKNLDALALAGDEAVLFLRVVGVGAFDREALRFDRFDEGVFHRLLGGPAGLIRGETQIAAGDELDGWLCRHGGRLWPARRPEGKPTRQRILGMRVTILDLAVQTFCVFHFPRRNSHQLQSASSE